MEKKRLAALFDNQAYMYAQRRHKKSFDFKWRKKLLQHARGRILEVAVGAGVNFQFYPKSVEVTAVDLSPSMLEKAKEAAREYGIRSRFIASDIEDLTFPSASFDTVISTLALCAYQNPIRVLNLFNQWCKEGGQVLLLEHGISSSRLIAWFQHKMTPWHVKKVGCYMNRDILKIVADSDLVVEKSESYWRESIHLIWAKKNSRSKQVIV